MNSTPIKVAPEGIAYLDTLKNYERTGSMAIPTLDRMTALVAALGNPQRAYPVIHVTGTNGKGSTTAIIAQLLAGRGMGVGTYTSPHIERITERVTVDGIPVANADLVDALVRVERAAGRIGVTPSWFEAMTAAGLWLLAAHDVDVAVVEVGMLGRWDATNVVHGAVAVITNVQLDHTDMAGPTRAAIATEKAGIIESGATLVLGETDPELRTIFTRRNPAQILTMGREMTWSNRRATSSGSIVDLTNCWGTRSGVDIAMAGAHQCDNAMVALTAAEAFTGSAIPAAGVSSALARARLAGRFEIVRRQPTVILDGAHNPAAADALRRTMADEFAEDISQTLIIGALAGRDPIQFLEHLGARSAELLIATEPPSPRALPAPTLADAARSLGVTTLTVADPAGALLAAMTIAGVDGLVLATGSLHLIAPLRSAASRIAAPGC